ncbi:MAG: D-alanyl-lipoteichoic acid biosynthesis protein DltD [Lachnospirales bacterium]
MKLFGVRTFLYIIIMGIFLLGINYIFVPKYSPMVSKNNFDEKLKGTYLLNNSPENNVVYLGASELNSKFIQSHPSNFFSDENDFLVNTVGRGSCQSIVFASLLGAVEGFDNKKVAITFSPQSFVEGGIPSDMYFANFSPLHYLEIQDNEKLSKETKDKFLNRFKTLDEQYTKQTGDKSSFYNSRVITKAYLSETFKDKVTKVLIKPYVAMNKAFLKLSDRTHSYVATKSLEVYGADRPKNIDYEAEQDNMIAYGIEASSNNEFQMDNDYYNVYIGQRLERLEGRDAKITYDNSVEYDDVELLLEVCQELNIEPLIFVHPFHAKWSDYAGIDIDTRYAYYDKIDKLLSSYNANYVNMANMEYVDYYMCDVLHYGWLGWLDVDKRISEFYYEN